MIKILIWDVDLDVDKGVDKNSQDNHPGRLCILLGRQEYGIFPDMPTMGHVILATKGWSLPHGSKGKTHINRLRKVYSIFIFQPNPPLKKKEFLPPTSHKKVQKIQIFIGRHIL